MFSSFLSLLKSLSKPYSLLSQLPSQVFLPPTRYTSPMPQYARSLETCHPSSCNSSSRPSSKRINRIARPTSSSLTSSQSRIHARKASGLVAPKPPNITCSTSTAAAMSFPLAHRTSPCSKSSLSGPITTLRCFASLTHYPQKQSTRPPSHSV